MISHGRVEEKPKGTEQLKIVARGLFIRRALKGKIATIFDAVRPMGDCEELKRDYFLRFPPSRIGPPSFTSLSSHIHRMWGSIGSCGSRGTTADSGRRGLGGGGAAVHTIAGCLTTVVRVRVQATLRTRCARLGTA